MQRNLMRNLKLILGLEEGLFECVSGYGVKGGNGEFWREMGIV